MVEILKPSLRVIGVAGLVIFGGLFAATFWPADSVERVGQAFIQYQIGKEVRQVKESVVNSTAGNALEQLKHKYQAEAQQIQSALDNDLPARIARVVAAMCRLDCEKQRAVEQSIEAGYEAGLASTGVALDTLGRLIRGKYLEIVANLTRDVRIFLGSNALLFLLVAALAFLKPRATVQLYLPAVFLVVSAIVCSGLYIFGQNWFFTILYNDYVGFGYVAHVVVLFGFLCDIALNRARVTTEVVNTVLSTAGSALQAVPC